HCVNATVCCHTACTKQVPSTCGTNGLCADDGASCQDYGAGTTCGTPVCSGATITPSACDGNGTCIPGLAAPCPGNFACLSPSACYASCQADSACAPGYYCVTSTGVCAAQVAAGKPCTANDQCQSGQCSTGTHVCM